MWLPYVSYLMPYGSHVLPYGSLSYLTVTVTPFGSDGSHVTLAPICEPEKTVDTAKIDNARLLVVLRRSLPTSRSLSPELSLSLQLSISLSPPLSPLLPAGERKDF
jgi:hypothetical protein